MNTIKKNLLFVAIASAVGASAPAFAEGPATSLAEAISGGDVKLNFRMRYEDVDQETAAGTDKESSATTLRSRITLSSAALYGFTGLIEVDDVTELGSVDYTTSPADASQDADAAGIFDPEGTEMNQAWLAYSYKGNTLTYGRQRIVLDGQRFFGGVAFRQNEQTYDGVTFKSTAIKDTEVYLGHITRVNRIFGEDRKLGEPDNLGDHDNSTEIYNVSYSGLPIGKLTGYHYDIDNEDAAAMSNKTSGVSLTGKKSIFGYALEYAKQSDAHENAASYDAKYYLAEGSVKLGMFTVTAGQEVLGADDTDGQFITPYATLHKFQGWTDTFLGGGTGNKVGGIEDSYVSVGTPVAGVNVLVSYHTYDPDDNDAAGVNSYGSEYGVEVIKKFGTNYELSVKYSDFSEDDGTGGFQDNSKLWLTATAAF